MLYGYSDTLGNENSNRILAEKRALCASEYFKSLGYDYKYITVNAVGETTEFGQNFSDNRCVKIELNTTKGIYDLISVDQSVQSYSVSTSTDTFIECEKGTIIKVPAHAFQSSNGKIAQNVELVVKEYYSLNDFMFSDLTIQTNKGGFLQTGGTVYIEALSSGEKVKLKEGKKIQIEMLPESTQPGMKLFTGYKDNGSIVWNNSPISQPSHYGLKYNH